MLEVCAEALALGCDNLDLLVEEVLAFRRVDLVADHLKHIDVEVGDSLQFLVQRVQVHNMIVCTHDGLTVERDRLERVRRLNLIQVTLQEVLTQQTHDLAAFLGLAVLEPLISLYVPYAHLFLSHVPNNMKQDRHDSTRFVCMSCT